MMLPCCANQKPRGNPVPGSVYAFRRSAKRTPAPRPTAAQAKSRMTMIRTLRRQYPRSSVSVPDVVDGESEFMWLAETLRFYRRGYLRSTQHDRVSLLMAGWEDSIAGQVDALWHQYPFLQFFKPIKDDPDFRRCGGIRRIRPRPGTQLRKRKVLGVAYVPSPSAFAITRVASSAALAPDLKRDAPATIKSHMSGAESRALRQTRSIRRASPNSFPSGFEASVMPSVTISRMSPGSNLRVSCE